VAAIRWFIHAAAESSLSSGTLELVFQCSVSVTQYLQKRTQGFERPPIDGAAIRSATCPGWWCDRTPSNSPLAWQRGP
jgi:hypothetical protein